MMPRYRLDGDSMATRCCLYADSMATRYRLDAVSRASRQRTMVPERGLARHNGILPFIDHL